MVPDIPQRIHVRSVAGQIQILPVRISIVHYRPARPQFSQIRVHQPFSIMRNVPASPSVGRWTWNCVGPFGNGRLDAIAGGDVLGLVPPEALVRCTTIPWDQTLS